jgi:prevent-host-death family protein
VAKIRIEDLKPVSATEAKVRFGELLHQTSVNGRKFVINRQGRPVSVILSYNEYLELIGLAEERK